jgi:Zn-finger domain-containing protein
MKSIVFTAALMTVSSLAVAKDYVTPADLSADASDKMYTILTQYNSCMMQSRLKPMEEVRSGQDLANKIMQGCETHLDELKVHLTDNDVEPALVEGMAKKMRSRAARKLMTDTMNNLAAQANAAGNAEKKQEKPAE